MSSKQWVGVCFVLVLARATGAAAQEELRTVPDLRLFVESTAALPELRTRGEMPLQEVPPAAAQLVLTRRRLGLNIDPLLDEFVRLARSVGIPVRPYGRSGGGPVGLSASFRVRDDTTPLNFHLGERSPDPLGAFYSTDSDVSWALSWPVGKLTLRFEGGDESEFGYYAIAGTQWQHPTRPLAAGFGIPMHLRNADGELGLIFQFRMQLR